MVLAAIDIGSNAARLLIIDAQPGVKNEPVFLKQNLIRVPLRLGMDVFETGEVSQVKINRLLETLRAFQHLMNVYRVAGFRAVATSAIREAGNKKQILKQVFTETGIQLDVLSGEEESRMILEGEAVVQQELFCICADVGGGSTEIKLFQKGKRIAYRSFNIGTIRMLKRGIEPKEWDELRKFLAHLLEISNQPVIVGTGGNINKIFTMFKKKEGEPLMYPRLSNLRSRLRKLPLKDRMIQYRLREDRADVIIPALDIFLFIMLECGISRIHVPKTGLADAIVREVWENRASGG